MKRNALLIIAACGVIALAAWQLAPATPHEDAVSVAAPTPSAAAGYRIQLDFNGEITEEAPPADAAELTKALDEAVNTSSEGLFERPSPVAGGGMMMDLQGRFQTTATAAIDANGNLSVPCVTNEAEVEATTETHKEKE